MAGRAFLDTHVLVYLLDRSAPGKAAVARALLREDRERGELFLSTQVLQEFYATVAGRFRRVVAPGTAMSLLERFAGMPLVVVEPVHILAAARRSREDRLAFWDSLIVEAALSAGCTRLLSEDFQDGRVFDGLRVENPFAAGA